ncbi:MAG: alkaline phosphatase [Phycisphaerales bacterium]|nr:alkaline phosphatase [Phycisphaerales bacterium]
MTSGPASHPEPIDHVSRRGFLAVGAGALLASQGAAFRSARAADLAGAGGRAKNVIVLVSDGMSVGTLTLTDQFLLDRFDRRSHWTGWLASGGARRSLVATESANSLVTDSAAAASCWSIGQRVDNGALNVTPAGAGPEPLWARVRRAGRAAGVVTTTRVTHATPAAFIVNHPSRSDESEIGAQMLERGLDLALGGGAMTVSAKALASRPDVRALSSRDELLALRPGAHAGPVFGLFADQHLSFEVDRMHDGAIGRREPTLAEMSRWAIEHLSRRAEGFALLIEGGRVDHAAHNNDASILFEQWAFDEALRVALDFAAGRDDTLIVATTDHGNANPGFSGSGRYGRSAFARTQGLRRSFEWLTDRHRSLPAGERTPESFAALVTEATGLVIENDERAILARWLAGERVDPFAERSRSYCPLGSLLANRHGVAFLTPHHTSDHVELAASGPGSERIPSFSHLTDLHGVMIRAMGLEPALTHAR